MINKILPSVQAALADVPDGATVMIGGFGGAGQPNELEERVTSGALRLAAALGLEVRVMPCDPALADTAAFCEAYGVALEDSATGVAFGVWIGASMS